MDDYTKDKINIPCDGFVIRQDDYPYINIALNDLKSEAQTKKETIDLKDKIHETSHTIKNANTEVLIKNLSPEINKNEAHKRFHKGVLLTLLTCFIFFQFWTVYIFTDKTL